MLRPRFAPIVALALATAGCAAQPGLPAADEEAGTVSLALTASAAEGTVYRLRGAVFTISGPIHAVLSSELDAEADAPALETALPPGSYTLELEPGWSLYRVEGDGSETWMQAEITSDNPVAFTVSVGAIADVRFRFLIDSEIAAGERGDVSVGFDVDEEECPTWYLDCDADGFAPADGSFVQSCVEPEPDAACAGGQWIQKAPDASHTTDCWDTDARARPGAAAQTTAIPGAPAARDFDFNCDAVEQRQITALAVDAEDLDCHAWSILGSRACTGWQGWYAYSVPACGVEELYSFCAFNDHGSCRRTYDRRVQACR